MKLNMSEKNALNEMLDLCHAKFGDFKKSNIIVCENGCSQCSGGCDGHGISVWTACDVK